MEKRKWGNLPCFAQYVQTFHLFLPLEDNTTAIDDPAVSACPCFLGHLSPSDARHSFTSFTSSASCRHLSASACKQAASLAQAMSMICSQSTHSSCCARTHV